MLDMPTMLFFEDQPKLAARYPRADAGELGWMPAVDVRETQEEVFVMFSLPGVRREEIAVDAEAGRLTVSGRRTRKVQDGWLRLEMIAGPFSRAVDLPARVRAEEAALSHFDGILEVRLPKERIGQPLGMH